MQAGKRVAAKIRRNSFINKSLNYFLPPAFGLHIAPGIFRLDW